MNDEELSRINVGYDKAICFEDYKTALRINNIVYEEYSKRYMKSLDDKRRLVNLKKNTEKEEKYSNLQQRIRFQLEKIDLEIEHLKRCLGDCFEEAAFIEENIDNPNPII